MSDNALIQLHIGLGSFHRAHQAVYLHDLRDNGDKRWHIVGGNIRSDMEDTMKALMAQKCHYTLETVTPSGERAYQRIESISHIIPYDEQLTELMQVATDPNTRIISFTVTEAGYYLDGDNNLDDSFPDLHSDLSKGTRITVYGALEAMLDARRQANAGPVTLLSCDNLRSNGERFATGFQQFLQQRGNNNLLTWVKEHTSTPSSMVDRITPRPTPDIAERVQAQTGMDDAAALMGESFIQWVIEDNFIAGRPEWETVGVEMVSDVMPYEEAKIRLLNATHSCVAWAGTLRGYQYIHEDCEDPEVLKLAYNYVTHDTIPVLDTPENPCPLDLHRYRDVVLDRFANPNILDTNKRVVMDAYSKIPAQIVPTIRECLAAGRSIDSVSMLPALFLLFLQYEQRGAIPFEYQDQAMTTASAQAICNAEDVVHAFVNDRLLFDDLTGDEQVLNAMRNAYQRVQNFANKT